MTTEPSIDLEFKILQVIDQATHRMLHRDVLLTVSKAVVGVIVSERLNPTDFKLNQHIIAIGITQGPGKLYPIRQPKDCDGSKFSAARIDTKVVSRLDCSKIFNIIHHLENCFK